MQFPFLDQISEFKFP